MNDTQGSCAIVGCGCLMYTVSGMVSLALIALVAYIVFMVAKAVFNI